VARVIDFVGGSLAVGSYVEPPLRRIALVEALLLIKKVDGGRRCSAVTGPAGTSSGTIRRSSSRSNSPPLVRCGHAKGIASHLRHPGVRRLLHRQRRNLGRKARSVRAPLRSSVPAKPITARLSMSWYGSKDVWLAAMRATQCSDFAWQTGEALSVQVNASIDFVTCAWAHKLQDGHSSTIAW
jgi:hypothetical protein